MHFPTAYKLPESYFPLDHSEDILPTLVCLLKVDYLVSRAAFRSSVILARLSVISLNDEANVPSSSNEKIGIQCARSPL